MRGEEWSEEDIVRLRQLWNEGHSAAEIGRRIKKSKNAVIGKVRRIGLVHRPNPVACGRPFTDEESEIIRDGVESGLDDDQIAARLTDRSRVSVQRKRYRMDLLLSEDTARRLQMQGSIKSAAKARAKHRINHAASIRRAAQARQEAFSAAAEQANGIPPGQSSQAVVPMKPFMVNDGVPKPPTFPVHAFDLLCEAIRNDERPADGCRWLVNDGGPWMVCAAKRELGESYCTDHLSRAFRPFVAKRQLEDAA